MNASTEHRPVSALALFLAGLQAGMVSALWMLTWLGVSALYQRRGFWNAANLMASVVAGNGAIRNGFGTSTLAGIALYLILYSLLGAIFAMAARDRFTGLGTLLVAMLYSIGWYYLWFRWAARTLMPLVWLLHAERATVFGHAIYGALLTRFPAFLPSVGQAPQPVLAGDPNQPMPVPAQSSSPQDPVS